MKQRTIQTLYAYWNDLRAGRIAPGRLEIEPSRISATLPETFMLERTDPASYHYRLAGTRLCEIFGTELRGTNLLDGWTASDRTAIAASLKSTCEQGAVTLLTIEAGADMKRRVQLEVIMLPLMHANNTMERVIGAMSVLTSPHWLGYEHLTSQAPDRPQPDLARRAAPRDHRTHGSGGAIPARATNDARGTKRPAHVSRFRWGPQQGLRK